SRRPGPPRARSRTSCPPWTRRSRRPRSRPRRPAVVGAGHEAADRAPPAPCRRPALARRSSRCSKVRRVPYRSRPSATPVPARRSGAARVVPALVAAAALLPALGPPATAHGFTSTVYADATTSEPGVVRTELGLEYDLLVVSAAENAEDPAFFDEGMAVWETSDEPAALAKPLADHTATVLGYVTERFTVSADGVPCAPEQVGLPRVTEREGVPYAVLVLDHTCPPAETASAGRTDPVDHEVRSTLFADDEGYVTGTTTILDYNLAGVTGGAALTQRTPAFSTVEH